MFTCSKCKLELDESRRAGRRPECKACNLAVYRAWKAKNLDRLKTRMERYREKNGERISAQVAAYKENHREKVDTYNSEYRKEYRERINTWRSENRDKVNPTQNAYRAKNRARIRAQKNEWHKKRMKTDPVYAGKVVLWCARMNEARRAVMDTPISRYFESEILTIYGNCPEGHQVDHIMPLRPRKGKACGLHVPWNLQYLTIEENLRKSDKMKSDWEMAA